MSKNNKEEKNTFEVEKLPQTFVDKTIDYEKYVLVHSRDYSKIMGKASNDSGKGKEKNNGYWEGLVKITNSNRKCQRVYRKCRSFNELCSGKLAIGYRTQKELFPQNDQEDMEVIVEQACWFCYLWCHQDSAIKHPFRLAVVGLLITIATSLLPLIMDCCCCK